MADRAALIADFLTRAGWGNAARAPLAGDASARRYERLTQGAEMAVLMDAPGGDLQPFLRVAHHLSSLGLSAPEALAEDTTNGLLLLEDFGDALYARLVEAAPSCEEALYIEAVEVLIALHAHPAPDWAPDFGPASMTEAIAPAWDWYAKGITGSADGLDAAQAEMETLLATTASDPVLILRDFHAENLFWLPDRKGIARVGLIDFQDALAGPRAYDLVSLTEDARRDVDPTLADRLTDLYAQRTGQDPDHFRLAAAACAAQRNLRILGVFARLSLHFGKPHYIDLIPRVWGLLQRDLAHPRLSRLRDLCTLPEPTPDNLQILRDKCGTIPTLS